MVNIIGSIVTSIFLFAVALVLGWWGVLLPRQRRGEQLKGKFSRRELRRVAISVMLILVSVMIFASVTLISFHNRPGFWTFYMFTVFTILLGVIILAIFDSLESLRTFLINLHYTRHQIREQKKNLEGEVKKLKQSLGSNNGKGR
ncbi:hypothetical protein ACFL27_01730 [candidate division CSSED10-310 bacterium]|uniref:DUF2304 domain-containing protein n=1 Tax=candidate division CSSED10-310 bacterium TaxID=2855610 RepID=A0ABV6YRS9_UNCC1